MVGPARATVNELLRRAGWRTLVWAALLAVMAAVLDFIPLFDLLGYDFSFALGLAAAFAGADIGQGVVAAARRSGMPASVPVLAARALGRGLAVLAAPLLLSLANMIRVRNCNVGAGLAFFALLPVGTMLFAAPAGVVAGLALPHRGRLLALLLPVASLGWTLVRLYRDPAVFAFDPFGGYFPGPIYDEAMRPPLRLLLYRAGNLVWIGAAIALAAATHDRAALRLGANPRRWCRSALAVAVVLVAGSALLFAARGHIGFHVTAADLRRELGLERRSPHFVLRYAAEAERTAADVDLTMQDLEFRYHQLRRVLGVEPAGPVTIYQFPSPAAKKALVGAATTLYAKPWTREVFLQTDRFPSGRLRHELAHVFAGAFGDRMFGVSLAWRRWGPLPVPVLASGLIEGVAEAADYGDPDGALTVHQEARAIVADGRAPPMAQVVGAGFTTLSGARAYTLAGSFSHFLLETQGADKLRRLYRSAGDFPEVYGRPLAALETEWRAFLERQPLSDAGRAVARERFRKPAIFSKVCAREIAARVAEARGLLRSDPGESVRLLEETCREDPHEPTFRLDLAEALAAAGEAERGLQVLAAVEADPGTTEPLRARAATLASTISFHRGDTGAADAAIRRALDLASDEGDRRTARAKLRALSDADARRTLGRALYGEAPGQGTDPVLIFHLVGEFARLSPGEALGPYLVGRQLLSRDAAIALDHLALACGGDRGAPDLAVPLPEGFERECLRMLGEAAFRAGQLGRSRAAYERLRDSAASEADRLRALDFIERIAWRTESLPTRPAEEPPAAPPAPPPARTGSSTPE